ncbi:putative metal-binding motif-containing protein [Myxococcota bacterium]|nr:putative metal-binding motif-containing protein [Myxococcota bacterium]
MLSLLTLLSCLTSPKDYKVLREAALDHDQDGFVSAEHPEEGGDDCDDDRAETFPDAPELCDGLDNDCDSLIDEGVTDMEGLYHDEDRDSYGGAPVTTCPLPDRKDMSDLPGDCDDDNSTFNPKASDGVQDGFDQNCDGVDGTDGDGDGVASIETGGTDCNDTNATAYPGAEEVCFDLVDNDCDDWKDEGADAPCIEEGMIIITEFQPSSSLPNPTGEWIELRNMTTNSLYLDGLQVNIDQTIESPPAKVEGAVTLAPGEIYLLCYSTLDYFACDAQYGDGKSYDTTDTTIPNLSSIQTRLTVHVTNGEATVFTDTVSFNSSFGWPEAPDGTGSHSLELSFDGDSPSTDGFWCRNTTDVYLTVTEDGVDYSDYGTPGAPNTCTEE